MVPIPPVRLALEPPLRLTGRHRPVPLLLPRYRRTNRNTDVEIPANLVLPERVPATRDQAQDSVQITETMDVIQEITAKTSEGSNLASGSIGELSDMVKEMQKSVAGFKLPGVDSVDSDMVQEADDLAALCLDDEVAE